MRYLVTLVGCGLVAFSAMTAVAQEKQAPAQAPTQKPVQAPVQKVSPVQKPTATRPPAARQRFSSSAMSFHCTCAWSMRRAA